jgi:hypothetical protein
VEVVLFGLERRVVRAVVAASRWSLEGAGVGVCAGGWDWEAMSVLGSWCAA